MTEKNPPPISLAKPYKRMACFNGHWASEKLDGVRAYWNGERFVSRGGIVYNAPDWFVRDMPSKPLDGELWAGRGQFEQAVSAARKIVPVDREWKAVTYQVFDLPSSDECFDERLSQLGNIIPDDSPTLRIVQHWRVCNEAELMRQLAEIVELGGEGIMLRSGSAKYTAGRSNDLLKVKPVSDAEATVIGYIPGKGRHVGRMGALEVECNGLQFAIGTGYSDDDRTSPPPIGAVVTYCYQGLTAKGVPRHASFLRIRKDLD